MDHVAIMKKSWRLTGKILSGKKKIESRWYKSRRSPWGKIKKDDVIYFKNSGEPASIKAMVQRVIQFSGLTPKKVGWILNKYGNDDGIEKNKIPQFFDLFKDKKYCLLIFLKNPKRVKPFNVDKSGFGAMSAWISIDDINNIKASQ